jgi:hypothetical protein
MIKPIREHVIEDADHALAQEKTQLALEDLTAAVNGLLLSKLANDHFIVTGIVLSTTDAEIRHGLKRVPTMILPLLLDASTVPYKSPTVHTDPKNYIYVRAGATVTATLLIA